ncbi:hypothetical protein ACR4XJ_11180 [Nitratidesulfovibrio sp. D1]|uniref:hypothetical protein n=1 Tax=Nitratidesulfovibrio sp. D1 TaxID=3440151 RepID=UPI003EBD034D
MKTLTKALLAALCVSFLALPAVGEAATVKKPQTIETRQAQQKKKAPKKVAVKKKNTQQAAAKKQTKVAKADKTSKTAKAAKTSKNLKYQNQ